jgi:hypothetical protein
MFVYKKHNPLLDEVESQNSVDFYSDHSNQRQKSDTQKNVGCVVQNGDGKYNVLQYTGTDGMIRNIVYKEL